MIRSVIRAVVFVIVAGLGFGIVDAFLRHLEHAHVDRGTP